jgi:hypothetical protein
MTRPACCLRVLVSCFGLALLCPVMGCSSDGDAAPGAAGGGAGASGVGGAAGNPGQGGTAGKGGSGQGGQGGGTAGGGQGGSAGSVNPDDGPPAGNKNAEATCDVPSGAGPEDISNPTTVVGTGTPESCTSDGVVKAVAAGGVITFNCGKDPVVIKMEATAKVFNDKGPNIVIDGGDLVTLSGQGARRILYMNTCDEAQVWTTDHCQNQDSPHLTVQNITFADGNSKAESEYDGGGAVWVRGGRFKVVHARFFNSVCADSGSDLGGGGIRVFSQFEGQPVYIVNSTFGGKDGFGGACANGGGISSIGVSWTIINSLFSYNSAVGNGGNASEGGSGGAIYNDGDMMTLSLCGTRIEYNKVNAYGSAIFFVSNNHTGIINIDRCVITKNIGGSWYPKYPQISAHEDTPINVTNSTIEN